MSSNSTTASATTTLPITFRSLAIETDGGPFTLHQKTITTLQPDELLIRVAYASINAGDSKLWQHNSWHLPTPYVLGFDFSGTVVLAGAAADGEVAKEVVVAGSEVMGCTEAGGCFAEYVVAKKKNTVLRGGIPAADAATYGIAYGTAYESVMVADDLSHRGGQTIFIPGAAGGVSHFAVQLAKLYGLTVIGSASKPDSLALLHKLGVEHIIDYSQQDVAKEVLALTDGNGVDIAYDATCQPSSMKQSVQCVRPGGTWVKLGRRNESGVDDSEAVAIAEQRGVKFVQGEYGRYFRDPVYVAQLPKVVDGLRRAVEWHREGKVRPCITAVVPLDAVAVQQVFEPYVKQKKSIVGKIVVKVEV